MVQMLIHVHYTIFILQKHKYKQSCVPGGRQTKACRPDTAQPFAERVCQLYIYLFYLLSLNCKLFEGRDCHNTQGLLMPRKDTKGLLNKQLNEWIPFCGIFLPLSHEAISQSFGWTIKPQILVTFVRNVLMLVDCKNIYKIWGKELIKHISCFYR